MCINHACVLPLNIGGELFGIMVTKFLIILKFMIETLKIVIKGTSNKLKYVTRGLVKKKH